MLFLPSVQQEDIWTPSARQDNGRLVPLWTLA